MKKPRVDDFDPDAAARLSSPLDKMPMIQPPVRRPPAGTAPAEPGRVEEPSEDTVLASRANVRPYGRTGLQRSVRRYAFEFYQDQVDTLRKLSLEEKLQGGRGNMSEMVREAVDMYIANKEKERD